MRSLARSLLDQIAEGPKGECALDELPIDQEIRRRVDPKPSGGVELGHDGLLAGRVIQAGGEGVRRKPQAGGELDKDAPVALGHPAPFLLVG